MSGRLFHRAAAVTLTKPVLETEDEFALTAYEQTSIRITDLRMSFSIEKHLGKEPNACDLSIFNLSRTSRAELQTKPLHVRIDAGYDGDLRRIFTGDLRWGQSLHDGVTWESKLQLGDGDRAFRFGRVARSYKAGVTALDAAREIAAGMGYRGRRFAPSPAVQAQLARAQYVSGLSVQGQAQQELSRVLAAHGVSWSIQDDDLLLFVAGEYRVTEPIVVSQDTGMIGVPESAAPEKPGKPPVLTVRMLLHPDLAPGGRVKLETATHRGLFKVERVVHEGDTAGSDWTSTIEAVPT